MKKALMIIIGVIFLSCCGDNNNETKTNNLSKEPDLPSDCFMVFSTEMSNVRMYITYLSTDGRLISIVISHIRGRGFVSISSLEIKHKGRSYCPGPDPRCAELEKYLKSGPDTRKPASNPKKPGPEAKKPNQDIKDWFKTLKK